MNKKRGRPENLLARMSGETRTEICNAITYGTRAWRFIRIRQLLGERRGQALGDKRGLRPDYLSAGLAAIQAQAEFETGEGAIQRMKALDRLWNVLRAKNKGKPPTRRVWLKEREKLLARLRPRDRWAALSKEWVEAACLWRELSQQFEIALAVGDDDWLNDLAKAIRAEASPEKADQFTSKVLVLLQRMAGATASDIFKALRVSKRADDKLDVEGRVFANKQGVLDAIHDIAKKVNHELQRIATPFFSRQS
jgi:hypothetical protein